MEFSYNLSGGILNLLLSIFISSSILSLTSEFSMKIYFLFCFQAFINKIIYNTTYLLLHIFMIIYSILGEICGEVASHFHNCFTIMDLYYPILKIQVSFCHIYNAFLINYFVYFAQQNKVIRYIAIGVLTPVQFARIQSMHKLHKSNCGQCSVLRIDKYLFVLLYALVMQCNVQQ